MNASFREYLTCHSQSSDGSPSRPQARLLFKLKSTMGPTFSWQSSHCSERCGDPGLWFVFRAVARRPRGDHPAFPHLTDCSPCSREVLPQARHRQSLPDMRHDGKDPRDWCQDCLGRNPSSNPGAHYAPDSHADRAEPHRGIRVHVGAIGYLRSLLFGLEPTDPFVMALAALAVISATTIAAWLPARRATRIDPMSALQ